MNSLNRFIAILTLPVVLVTSAAVRQDSTTKPRLFALLIGLNNYDMASQGFGKLNGAQDVERMLGFLRGGTSHSEAFTRTLTTPSETNKAKIEESVRQFLVENRDVRSGDIVVLYYSGHGTQVTINGKVKQAIVPIDVKRVAGPKSEIIPNSVIAGPQIGTWLKALTKKTDNVTFIFDGCSTANITRGTFRAKSGYPSPSVASAVNDPVTDEADLSGAVVMSAADRGETAYEVAGYGIFTKSLIDAATFLAAQKRPWSYQELKKRISTEILRHEAGETQHPQYEGRKGMSRPFLGQGTLPPPANLVVNVTPPSGLRIKGGEYAGLEVGFTVGLYKPGTSDFSVAPVGKARVKLIKDGYAELETVSRSHKAIREFDGYWAIVLDGLPDGLLNVCFADLEQDKGWSELSQKLQALPFVRSNPENYDVRITPPAVVPASEVAAGRAWSLTGFDGRPLKATTKMQMDPKDLEKTLLTDLVDAAKFKALKRLKPQGDQQLRLEARLVRVDVNPAKKSEVTAIFGPMEQAEKASEDEFFCVAVRALAPNGLSKGAFNPYLAIWEMTPNGSSSRFWPRVPIENANAVLPADGSWYYLGKVDQFVPASADLKVAKDKLSLLSPRFFQPSIDGVGENLFKVFATKTKEDFDEYLSTTSSEGERSDQSTLGSVFKRYSTGKAYTTRGDSVSSFNLATCIAVIKATPSNDK